jgi:branched-chain amino acid transport system permease protein
MLQATFKLGAEWKLVLGIVFVLLVCFLRQGIIGGLRSLVDLARGKRETPVEHERTIGVPGLTTEEEQKSIEAEAHVETLAAPTLERHHRIEVHSGPILEARGLTKRYGGIVANADIDFTVAHGELRGIIGPNGAGKSTFFKMLTCEVPPSSGSIVFEGRDITRMRVSEVCQLGLTKSYQVNQLFDRLTVRENVTIAALAELRGRFRVDLLRSLRKVPGLYEQVQRTLELVHLTNRGDTPVAELAYGEKRRLEIGLALATSPTLLLLDEPLAGMSPRERVETVRLLKSIAKGRTMVVIDHDVDSLFALAERITVMQEGRVLVEGTPAEIKANPKVQEAYLGGVNEALAA